MPSAFVQQVETSNLNAGATSIATANLASNPTSTDLFWYVVNYSSATAATVTVTDTIGNTFVRIGSFLDSANQCGLAWGYAQGITGGSANAFTATFSAGIDDPAIYVAEYSGLSTTNAFTTGQFAGANPQLAPGTGTNNLTSGNTPALAVQPALQVGFCFDNTLPTNATPGSAFNARTGCWIFGGSGGAFNGHPEDLRLTSTAAVAALFNALSATDDYYTLTAVFNEPFTSGPTATVAWIT